MKNLLYIGNRLSIRRRTTAGAEVIPTLLAGEGYQVRDASLRKNRLVRLFDVIYRIFIYRKSTDFALIDTHSALEFYLAYVAARWASRCKVKYIVLLNSPYLHRRLKQSPRMSQKLFGEAYVNIAPSKYLLKHFTDEGFAVKYIPNPIDLSDFPFKSRPNIGPKMLYVRSLARIYNPQMALETLKIVAQRYPEATLYVVGRDKNKLLPRLKQYALQHRLQVTFTGKLRRQEWAALAADCDIFLNTAKVDHAPYSLLEAVSLGLYLVSNNVGGIPHIFQHQENAILNTPGDAKAMAASVFELIQNEELRQQIANNRVGLLERYQWASVKEHWHQLFENT